MISDSMTCRGEVILSRSEIKKDVRAKMTRLGKEVS